MTATTPAGLDKFPQAKSAQELAPLSLMVIVAALLMVFAMPMYGAQASVDCAGDLEAIPGFLQENDAGAKDALGRWGQEHFDRALAGSRVDVAHVQSDEDCERALNAYLKAWRKGHLRVRAVAPTGSHATVARSDPAPSREGRAPSGTPSITLLTSGTALLTIPSFGAEYRQPLIALLEQRHRELIKHRNWIIDVRGNDGGDDGTYAPLLPWMMHDELVDVGSQWLATPANVQGERQACALFEPGDEDCERFAAQAILRMSNVPPGSYVSQYDGPLLHYGRVEVSEHRRPDRVVILFDGRCASSCEEFLLTVRQSFAVKLAGRPSRGSLDYSNLRPFVMPSGKRLLLYAISRSGRLPDMPIDLAGVEPDIYLPEPADDAARSQEVQQLRRWVETGFLAPMPVR